VAVIFIERRSLCVSGLEYRKHESWFVPLPLVMSFGSNQEARGTIHAYGAKTPINVKVPMRPRKVELDPHNWVLSEKTTTKAR